MGIRVRVDMAGCQGYACCVMESPAVFDLDEDAGKVILLMESPDESLRASVAAAVRGCPAKAITTEDV